MFVDFVNFLYPVLAFLPFLLITYLLVIKKMQAFKVMSSVYFLTLLILFYFWRVDSYVLTFSSLRGFAIALEVTLIILSVLLLYHLMKVTGKLDTLKDFLKNFSSDNQIQIILIGWFVVAFFESIAGFGTPAAIAAPLLVLLGIKPLTAVILTLVADTAPVVFGAFGTPIIMGIGDVPGVNLFEITFQVALFSGFISIFMPILLLLIYNLLEYKNLKNFKKYILISLVAGISFFVPFVLVSYFIGPELPSVIAALVGFIITALFVKFGIFVKKEVIKSKFVNQKGVIMSILPYLILIILFIFTRRNFKFFGFNFDLGSFLREINFQLDLMPDIVTVTNMNLNHPWFFFFFFFILFFIFLRNSISKKEQIQIFYDSLNKVKFVFITLLFTLAFVQILIHSDVNPVTDLEGIPQTIASLFSGLGIFYILFAPLVGAFGSFIAGSATVSNIIFGTLQNSVAIENGLPNSLILALQVSGAAAGNMIAIHNILAVSALVNIKNQESHVIRINLIILGVYCLILSLLGFLLYFLYY